MNAYLLNSIQSAAYGNLFECSAIHEEDGCDAVFSSMSHENEVGVTDDVEETLSQLDDFGFDAFYELGGEYYGWHKDSPPPYEDFSESDLLAAEAVAEKLVSNYE